MYRHRSQILWTNPELCLLRGFEQVITSTGIESMVGSSAWFSQALGDNPLRVSAFGQVGLEHQRARLNWLLPLGLAESNTLPKLLDNLAMEAGLHSAKFIIASAQVDNCLFETLRRAGYCPCGWQSIWKFSGVPQNTKPNSRAAWRSPNPADWRAISDLQRKVLSPASRALSAISENTLPDFVLEMDGILSGYARISWFNNQSLITPIFMDSLTGLETILTTLVSDHFSSADALYFQQTADTNWLTDVFSAFSSQQTPRQETLVKHLAVVEKLTAAELNRKTSGQRADTAAPLMPSSGHRDNI